MSTTVVLMQQVGPMLRQLPLLAGIAALLVLFKPLLVGLARAAWLVMSPRLPRDEQRRRARMRDAVLLQRIIASSSGPSDASELRAMGGRD